MPGLQQAPFLVLAVAAESDIPSFRWSASHAGVAADSAPGAKRDGTRPVANGCGREPADECRAGNRSRVKGQQPKQRPPGRSRSERRPTWCVEGHTGCPQLFREKRLVDLFDGVIAGNLVCRAALLQVGEDERDYRAHFFVDVGGSEDAPGDRGTNRAGVDHLAPAGTDESIDECRPRGG